MPDCRRGLRLQHGRILSEHATSQSNLFGVGQFDVDAPLLNQPGLAGPSAGFRLPAELSGASPNYGYRDPNFSLSFENYLDLAAYVLPTIPG